MSKGQRVALIGVVISSSLALFKILTGVLSGSRALLADGFESTGDVLASSLVWLGLTYAAKPPDSNHPYGHGRAEIVSGLVVGLLLFCGGLAIAVEALASANGETGVPRAYAIWPLVISISAKIWMSRLKRRTGREIGSAALAADSFNDLVDVFSGAVALSCLGLTLFDPARFPKADHYGAFGVGLIMIGIGVRVARSTGMDLMDTMPENGLVERIRLIARDVPGVESVEKVFARKTGLQHHVDLHLWVDPDMTVRASHELGHLVERRLKEQVNSIAGVLVHIEPSARTVAKRR